MLKVSLCGFLALTSALMAASTARADGWSVSKKPSDGICLAGREGSDKTTKKKNALALGLSKDADGLALVITLTSQDWTFTKDQPVDAALVLLGEDGTTQTLKAKWLGDGQTLSASFVKAGQVIAALGASQAFTLRIDPNTGVTFDTPNAAGALDSAVTCLDAR